MNAYELLNRPSFFLCFELSVTCPSRELRDKAEKNMVSEFKADVFQLPHTEEIAFYVFFPAFLLNLESIFNNC